MSIAETKARMLSLLADCDNRVVALSGKWGTGKSHLWRDVKSASQDVAVQKSLYASLFGLNDMTQVKLKLVEGAVPDAENHKRLLDSINVAADGVKKFLVALHKGFSALDDLALLVLPTFLKDRVVVLDDIERKHDKLSIDEILGFIDEFTQRYGARFVLILNTDPLKDEQRKLWDTLREKVIDQKISLVTLPMKHSTSP